MFLNVRRMPLILCGIAGMILAPMAHAQTYNAASDFSIANNPNGVWQYGYTNTLDSSFILDPNKATNAPIDYWESIYGGAGTTFYPYISHNDTNTTVTRSTQVWQPGQVLVHPGPNGQYADIRWVAPATGTFVLNASFIGQDVEGTTTDVHIFDNGVSLFSGNINGYQDAESYSNTLSFAAGDTLDAVVGYGSNKNYFFDSTGVSVVLTSPNAVPEPGALLSYLTGGMSGVILLLRRRQKVCA